MTKRLFTLLTFALLTMGAAAQTVPDTLLFVFKLHGQTRRFEMSFEERNDSVRLTWGIERKLKWLSGTFTMTPDNMENGTSLSFLQPEDQQHIVMPAGETVYLIGRKAYRTLKATGRMAYNLTTYRLLDRLAHEVQSAGDKLDGATDKGIKFVGVKELSLRFAPLGVKPVPFSIHDKSTIGLTT